MQRQPVSRRVAIGYTDFAVAIEKQGETPNEAEAAFAWRNDA
jgi:hypothetical protein